MLFLCPLDTSVMWDRIDQFGRFAQTYKKLTVTVVIFLIFLGIYVLMVMNQQTSVLWGESISSNSAPSLIRYKIILDAGSTGTRIHVFEFACGSGSPGLRATQNNFPAISLLSIPLFSKLSDGGLSAYHDSPGQAAAGIEQLVDEAKRVVPKNLWSSSEIVLMATAGLRLLSIDKSNALLDVVRTVFSKGPFLPGPVDVIDGRAEARYIYWMSNFVAPPDQSRAIVDLGGGSVQLAYGGSKSGSIFFDSWLGYGLVAFRFRALEGGDSNPHPCVPEWTDPGQTYTYAGKTVNVVPRKTSASVSECMAVVAGAMNLDCMCDKDDIEPRMCGLGGECVRPIQKIQDWRLYSYIFDLALEEGLVQPHEHQATLTPSHFIDAAASHCENGAKSPQISTWTKCIDLVYVAVLLTEGFGLGRTFPVTVTKRLVYRTESGKQIEMDASWPLGAALEALQKEL